MTIIVRFTTFICVFIALAQLTLASDKVNIKSDNLIIKKSELTATFSGSVVLTFEDLKLYCSDLNIFYTNSSDEKEIKEIHIPGKLKAVKSCGQEILYADSGHFDNSTKKLTLTGNVQMLREGNVLVTNKLVYLTRFEAIDQETDAK